MNTLRKYFGLILVAAFALLSGAALAADKQFSMTVDTPGPATAFTFTIVNEGNSSFNSLTLALPANWTATGASAVRITVPGNVTTPISDVTLNGAKTVVTVNGINLPTGTGQKVAVTVTGVVAGNCAADSNKSWTATPWTGTPAGSGNVFKRTGSNPTTSVAACPSYTLTNLSVTSFPAGATTQLTGLLANTSGTGGPTIDSIQLKGPNGITSVAVTGAPLPLAPGQSGTVTFSVKATCGAANGQLDSVALAGSLILTRTNTLDTETVTPKCSLAVTTPKNVIAGAPFNVDVTAKNGNNAAIALDNTTIIGLTSNPAGVAKNSQSAAAGVVTVNATLATKNSYVVTASGTVDGAPLSADTLPFNVFASGPLNCDPVEPFVYGDSSAGGQRGVFNKDGSPCQAVAYTFTNNVATDNSVLLTWDTTAQPNAAFETVVQWQPELVGPAGLPTKKTKVAWTFTGGLPDKVDARACIDSTLPTPYGTLSGFTAPDVIAINTTPPIGETYRALPAVYPYAIFIGGPKLGDPNTRVVERLHVTGTDPNGFKVVRAQGGTSQVDLAAVGSSAKVMSNPLPLDGASKQMQMCIAQEMWDVLKPGTAGCPAVGGTVPAACVRYTTTIFDIGDGFVSRDL